MEKQYTNYRVTLTTVEITELDENGQTIDGSEVTKKIRKFMDFKELNAKEVTNAISKLIHTDNITPHANNEEYGHFLILSDADGNHDATSHYIAEYEFIVEKVNSVNLLEVFKD
ncbi:hypothetical protein MEPL4_4c00090 [Melissococcus plutonius]|uniref:hypothetical protein n=1 Tax=Melissococcus plutonius TaxID=33970 RepID=UPI00065DCD9C|nr:hypothetical protein [Melissococcus plutonius]AIM25739.1 hypothetical protein MEPL_c009890 [Melissococcus plutonius S1]KMT25178.1 hypothetical protein MEPL2_2c07360 [Melissococcus plutonius]KMT26084.1 hypothetical protein MEPL3_3c00090 [Melissococcus plutonius]KMT26814.1 hypothetical protein MEPL1_4c00090 [Melissococcus plutonius]KMT28826.1 hypothetical protein MEPL4_4c00090 [Melissococcus plutonius]